MAHRGWNTPPTPSGGTLGIDYTASLTIQNLSNQYQHIRVRAYDSRGVVYTRSGVPLFPNAGTSITMYDQNLAYENFKGGVLLEGDYQFAATVVYVPPSNNPAQNRPVVNAEDKGSRFLSFPSVVRKQFARSSKINVMNTLPYVDSPTFKFFNEDGTNICTTK